MRAAGPFARLWAGQTVSVLGTSVSALAIPTLAILVLHVTPFAFGALQAAELAAYPVFGMIAGVLIDRWSRRRTMLVANVIRAIVLVTIPIAGKLHVLTFAHLFLVAIAVGTASVFFELSYSAYVPALVAPDRLETANARLEATNNGARFAGTGLAGALISALGAANVVIIDAASYLVSAALLFSLQAAEPHLDEPAAQTSFAASMREGFAFVMGTPFLRSIGAATAISNFAFGIVTAAYLLFLYRTLHFSPWLVGLLTMIGNVGFIGALAAPMLGRRFGARATIVGSYALFAVGALLFPLANLVAPIPVLVLAEIVASTSVPIYNVTQISMRQRIVPAAILGRVNAVMRTLVVGLIPVGSLIGGALASTVGIVPTLTIGAVIALFGMVPIVGMKMPAADASTCSA